MIRGLDLFCGAGGCSVGYHRAGIEMTGVDIEPQKNYPFDFVQMDALEYLAQYGHLFDFIHASPPCQRFSSGSAIRGSQESHPDLVTPTRELLIQLGLPYIIENVPGSPMIEPVMLCGTMFPELRVIRHRLFESNLALNVDMQCNHQGRVGHASIVDENGKRKHASLDEFEYITVAGHGYLARDGRIAMGIDWMTRDELSQAIPPAYTEYLGQQVVEILNEETLY